MVPKQTVPCVSRINTTRASIGGRTFRDEKEERVEEKDAKVEYRRLADESKSVANG